VSSEKPGGLPPEPAPVATLDATKITTTLIIKGGTSTSATDRDNEWRRHDAEKRRKEQDAMYAVRDTAAQRGDAVHLGSHQFVNETSPKLVLDYLNRDGSIRQQAISEITMPPLEGGADGQLDMMFTMVCPRCVARGVPMGNAQMMIRNSHRKFFLDERTKGVKTVEFAWGQRQVVVVAGTVTVQDLIKCDNVNCDFRCRIDKSQVREA
jgi:hypothetical protein